MAANPTEKECKNFKITLLLLPVIPAVILYYKGHLTAAVCLIAVFWLTLSVLLFANLIGQNIDKPVYKLVHSVLQFIGTVLSTVALFITWIFAIFPTALFAKIRKRDRLSLNKKR